MAITVRDALNRSFTAVPPETTCKEARKLIFTLENRSLWVVDKKKLAGVLTDGDFLKDHDLADPITAIMTKPVVTISEEAGLQDAARILTNNRIGQLGVVARNGEFIGMVTARDVVKDLIVHTRQPKLSPERAAIYLAMTNERDKEDDWMKKATDEGFKCAVTQVGSNADKLAQKLREAAIVAAIAHELIVESLEDKIAVSNAVRDAYSQLALTNPGLGGGFKMAIVRDKRLVIVVCFGRSGHTLANGPQQLVMGYSII